MKCPFLPVRFLLVLGLSLVCGAAWAGGNEVEGTYRVGNVTDLGPQVRVTLHIRLSNNTHGDLSVLQVALHEAAPARKAAATAAWAQLQPRKVTTVEQEFVISRREYERWSRGGSPMLEVTFQQAGGRAVTRTIVLHPSRDRRAQ